MQGDCNDLDDQVVPGAEEVANGIDDDCDGEIDEGFADADGDGFAVSEGDCDDGNGWANPEGSEVCDGIDNDCDDIIDEFCDWEAPLDPVDGACTCNSSGPAGWLGLLMVLGLTARRRVA